MNHIDAIPETEVINKFGNLDQLFQSADKDHDGYLNAMEARDFFPQFGLPNQFLSVVWKNCVGDAKRGMSRQEFTRAMKSVHAETGKQQEMMSRGFNMSPYPTAMGPSPAPTASMPMGPSPVPQTPMYGGAPGENSTHFAISPQERSKYEASFMKLAGTQSMVAKSDAKGFFLLSKVDQASLSQIWQLADMENRGALDKEEFCIAMHLTRLKVKNIISTIPPQLPPALIPAGKSMSLGGIGFSGAGRSSTPGQNMYDSNYGNPAMGSGLGISSNTVMPSQHTGGSGAALQASTEQKNALIKLARTLHDSAQKLLNGSKEILTTTFTTQNQLMDRKEQLENLRQEEKDLQEKSEQLKQQLEWSRGEMTQLETELSGHMGKVETMRHEKAMLDHELGELTREIERLKGIRDNGEHSTSGLSKEVEELEEQVQHNHQTLEKYKNEIYLNKRTHDTNLRRREELELEVRHVKQQFLAVSEELVSSKTDAEDLNSSLSFFESTKLEYIKAMEQLKLQIEETQKKKYDLVQRVDEYKKDLTSTQKEYSVTGNRAKQVRLMAILNSVTETLEGFDRLAKEETEFSDSAFAMSSDTNTFAPSTTTTDVENDNANVGTLFPSDFSHSDGFDEKNPAANSVVDFGDFGDFGSFSAEQAKSAAPANQDTNSKASESAMFKPTNKLPPAPSATVAAAVTQEREKQDLGFNDNFADFGSFGFKGDNSQQNDTNPTSLDDFGFGKDNFGQTSESQPTAKAELNDNWANFEDDFA